MISICCQLDAVFAAVKKCGSTWSPWARLQRLWKFAKSFPSKRWSDAGEDPLSARSFKWGEIVAVPCSPMSRGSMKKMPSKKVWEKFVAFVVKCRETRKHQESRRQWTRLQPGYDHSLQSSIPFRGNSVHFRVRGDWWKNVAKKVWEKFAAFVVKCWEPRKHQGSRWLRTRLQPVCGCSL